VGDQRSGLDGAARAAGGALARADGLTRRESSRIAIRFIPALRRARHGVCGIHERWVEELAVRRGREADDST
jgi:hypothetical protein